MSLGLDWKTSAPPLRYQGPRLRRAGGRPLTFHSPFLCLVLRPPGANRNTRDQRGYRGRAEPILSSLPLVPNAAYCTCQSTWVALCPSLVSDGEGPSFRGVGQRERGTDAGLTAPLLGPSLLCVPSVISAPTLSCALGSPCLPSQPLGRGPSNTTEGPGDPLPLVPFPLTPRAVWPREGEWALLS